MSQGKKSPKINSAQGKRGNKKNAKLNVDLKHKRKLKAMKEEKSHGTWSDE